MTLVWQQPQWPIWTTNLTEVEPYLQRCALARQKIAALATTLDMQQAQTAQMDLSVREALSTSAIEGVHIDPDSIRSSIMRRLQLTSDQPHRQTLGATDLDLADVMVDSTQNIEPLTHERIKSWHRAFFPRGYSGMNLVLSGEYRPGPMEIVSGRYGNERVHYSAPPPDRLEAEMDQFLKWFNHNQGSMDPTLRAAIAHVWFESIHPFEDGNGRVGRAIIDLALSQGAENHQPKISRLWAASRSFLRHRKDYYLELETAQHGDLQINAWVRWVAERVMDAYQEAHDCIIHVKKVADFWYSHRETPLNARQRKVINALLADELVDGNWISNLRYQKLTKCSDATATRDLTELVTAGMLMKDPSMSGRSTRYIATL